MSATCTRVFDVHEAVDVADGGIAVASISSNAASILEGSLVVSVDGKVLNETACRDDAEEAEVVLFRAGIEVLDGVAPTTPRRPRRRASSSFTRS